MRNVLRIIFMLVLAVALFSCKKEREMAPPELGETYFPVEKGLWAIYEVDSTVWNDYYQPVRVDTFHYYIKMVIDSSYIDNEGRSTQLWRKYYKNDSCSWFLVRNYALNKSSSRVETFEDNIRYIRMAFPIKNTTVWDMNAFNTEKANSSYYDDYDVARSIGGQNYDSCAIVIHYDDVSLINKHLYEEVYGKHVGLLQRRATQVTLGNTGEYLNGYQYTYTLIAHGTD